jgi:hypothetical protein
MFDESALKMAFAILGQLSYIPNCDYAILVILYFIVALEYQFNMNNWMLANVIIFLINFFVVSTLIIFHRFKIKRRALRRIYIFFDFRLRFNIIFFIYTVSFAIVRGKFRKMKSGITEF